MRASLTTIAVLALFAPLPRAAETWVPLNPNAPPGTPAQVVVDMAKSNPAQSHVNLTLAGFWIESQSGPDGTAYQRIRVPGLGHVGQTGAPDLPALRAKLAVVTSASHVKLANVTIHTMVEFPGITPYPLGTMAFDEDIDPGSDPGEGDTKGTEEGFQPDGAIYGGTAMWPPASALNTLAVGPKLGGVPGAECVCYPLRWNPTSKKLSVAVSTTYVFDHGGASVAQAALTKGEYKVVQKYFLNAAVVAPVVFENLNQFQSRYLIVTPAEYVDELAPFVLLKKSQGFQVLIQQLAGGENWLQVLAYVVNWYQSSIHGYEHYCLLIGDTNVLPLAYDVPNFAATDDYYGSPLDLDLDEEVYVGRLSVDSAADLTHQLQKIIDYQVNPTPGDYDDVILVAHKQGAPGKYEGAHESVRTASYSNAPDFKTRYGSVELINQNVINDIEVDAGLVCYRGHGSTNTWSAWTLLDVDFHKNFVVALTNEILPVAWAITCTNHNLAAGGGGTADCIGEVWLEAEHGAVASYGATRTTGTSANHELDRRLFQAVYDYGIVTHAHAIAYAEAKMMEAYPEAGTNAYAYCLLGDPSMKIRTDPLLEDLKADVPFSLLVPGGQQTVAIKARVGNVPLAGALVALYKGGSSPNAPDEIFVNGYTNAAGLVAFEVDPQSLGDIHYTVQDDAGNALMGTIPTVDAAGCLLATNASYGQGKPGSSGLPPVLSGVNLPAIGSTSTVRIAGGLPGAVPFLVLGLAPATLPFDGGTLLVDPLLIISIPAPIAADGTLTISGPIPNDPSLCGLELYHQVFYVDPGAAGFYHVALTNGLLRTLGGQ